MRIVSNEEIRTTKDTRKEENQNKLIKNWEYSEPKRAEFAAIFREIFLLSQKKRVASLTSKEEKKLKKLKKIEREQLTLQMQKKKTKVLEESELESDKSLIDIKKGKSKDSRQKNKDKLKKKMTKENNHENLQEEESDEESMESNNRPTRLTSLNSFSKPIRNLCRMWEGPKNLFINSHKERELRDEEFGKMLTQNSLENKNKIESFKEEMKVFQENVIQKRKQFYDKRRKFFYENRNKMMQIFQKTESQMGIESEKKKKESTVKANNEASIEQHLNEESQETSKEKNGKNSDLPHLENLHKIQQVHHEEIQLFSKIIQNLAQTRSREQTWYQILLFFKARLEAQVETGEGTNSKKASRKKNGDKSSKNSKSSHQNNISGFNSSSMNGRLHISEDIPDQGKLSLNFLI